MYVRSTGLGRTLLHGRLGELGPTTMDPATEEDSDTQPVRMVMVMEILEPVNWKVKAFMEPQDVRRLIWLILRPSTILCGLKLLFSKSRAANLHTVKDTKAKPGNKQTKSGSAPRKGERPRANVKLSPAQMAARKKKQAQEEKKAVNF